MKLICTKPIYPAILLHQRHLFTTTTV